MCCTRNCALIIDDLQVEIFSFECTIASCCISTVQLWPAGERKFLVRLEHSTAEHITLLPESHLNRVMHPVFAFYRVNSIVVTCYKSCQSKGLSYLPVPPL